MIKPVGVRMYVNFITRWGAGEAPFSPKRGGGGGGGAHGLF